MKNGLIILFLNMVIAAGNFVSADPFPDVITEFNPGTDAGFGQDELPGIVLGAPHGGGDTAGSLDVLSLGDGGTITLEFTDNLVSNGPGIDLIVFENPFFIAANPENDYSEVAFVEVSLDGENYFRFPNDYDPEGDPINNPSNWIGFAGVWPVLSHPDNGIDPTDPLLAGGDGFDLDDVGLNEIRFVRIIDTNEGDNAAMDDDGDLIYDPGWPGSNSAGFDLDAIAAVYSTDLPTPTPESTPTITATPTATPTFSPSPTPEPNEFQFNLTLTDTVLTPGDLFDLKITYFNPDLLLKNVYQYIILDVYGLFFYAPSWGPDHDFQWIDINTGFTETDILTFFWPEIEDHARGLFLWGGLLSEEGMLLGNINRIEFEY